MSDTQPGGITGRVFDIQRFSIHDGPGIRTTVFLQGCPLDCAWCHNPEGRAATPQLAFTPTLCIGCGFCFRHCEHGGHVMEEDAHRLHREGCVACFCCVRECYSGALEVVGSDRTVEEVIAEVLRDRPFYKESGGGMTLSGGEPLAQPVFAEALLRRAKDEGLHTCLETSGAAPWEDLAALVPHVDCFLYDYKETDPERHRACTGQDNARILNNLRHLDDAGVPILLRCPIIPGVNLRDDHLQGIADLAGTLQNLQDVNIMGFHRLGEGKRERIGLPTEARLPEGIENMTPEDVDHVVARLQALGTPNVTAG